MGGEETQPPIVHRGSYGVVCVSCVVVVWVCVCVGLLCVGLLYVGVLRWLSRVGPQGSPMR